MSISAKHYIKTSYVKARQRQYHTERKYTDRLLSDTSNDIDVRRPIFERFLEDAEDADSPVPNWDIEVITSFCNTASPANKDQPYTPVIRIDDREYGTNRGREYPSNLTPDSLRQRLSLRRFDEPQLPNVHHRQVLIQKPDGDYVRALIDSVSTHDVKVLKAALVNYLSGGTSLRVHRSPHGWVMHQFEMSFQYLALRRGLSSQAGASSFKWAMGATQAEFPAQVPTMGTELDDLFVHQRQVSFAFNMWDNTTLTAYGFSDPCPTHAAEDTDEPDVDGDDVGHADGDDVDHADGDDVDLADGDEGYFKPATDIFSPESAAHEVLKIPETMFDCRLVFLQLLECWVNLILREYRYLVKTLASRVKVWISGRTRNRAMQPNSSGWTYRKNTAIWIEDTNRTRELLCIIRDHMVKLTRVWKEFTRPEGDFLYFFQDLATYDVKASLSNLTQRFRDLIELQEDVIALERSCEDSTKIFQIDLDRENHSLHLESMARSLDDTDLNRMNTDAAIASQGATENTLDLARKSMLLIYLTSSLHLVAQYLSADHDVFASKKKLIVCAVAFVIMAFALPSLVYGLDVLRRSLEHHIVPIFGYRRRTAHVKDDAA